MHEKCTSLTRSSAKMAAERTLDTMHPWYCTSRLLHEANSYHLLIAQQVLADHFELQGAIRIDPMMNIRGCHAGETYNGQPRYSCLT